MIVTYQTSRYSTSRYIVHIDFLEGKSPDDFFLRFRNYPILSERILIMKNLVMFYTFSYDFLHI